MKTLSEILSRDKKKYFKEKNLINSLYAVKKENHPSVNLDQPNKQNNHNILVVDDSLSIISLINDALKDYYNVQVAFNGEEAIVMLDKYIPDMVLLDVLLPGINGYDLCRKIRSDKRFEFTKIIMISGVTQLEDRLKGFEAGADDYIAKPIELMELLAKVKVFIRLKECEDQLMNLNENLNKQVEIRSRQLIEAEKFTAIGQHAAGILHNLNTPLQAILSCAELLKMEYPENQSLDIMMRAAESLKDMTKTILMNPGKNFDSNPADIDFNKIITDQIEIMKMDPFFKYKVEKRLNLQTLPVFRGVRSHFIQSLGNLIKNAVEAMHDTEERVLEISTSHDEETIHINVSDSGCGIHEKHIEKIFQPFFTTKSLLTLDGRPAGTGLGLASTKEMIESYKGRITVKSKPGQGTCFKVSLPLGEES